MFRKGGLRTLWVRFLDAFPGAEFEPYPETVQDIDPNLAYTKALRGNTEHLWMCFTRDQAHVLWMSLDAAQHHFDWPQPELEALERVKKSLSYQARSQGFDPETGHIKPPWEAV